MMTYQHTRHREVYATLRHMDHDELEHIKIEVKHQLRRVRTPPKNQCPRCTRYLTRVGLTQRHEMAIRMRTEKKTYKEIGKELGLSIERSRQIVATGLKLLREGIGYERTNGQ